MWGVAHVDPGGEHVIQYRNRDDAERRLADCREDDASCYLVSAVVRWERMPDTSTDDDPGPLCGLCGVRQPKPGLTACTSCA